MTTAIEYALMAGAAYISNRDPINQFPVPQGWLATRHDNPPDGSGFEAISFINGTTILNSTEIVISYAGTDGDDGGFFSNPDMQADVALAAGLWSDQLGQAAAYYLEIKALNPSATISFTGHSLGGGLAALMSVFFGETAFTFDQAPFRSALVQAQNLKSYLLANESGTIDTVALNNLLVPLDSYIASATATLAARQAHISDINVNGEFLSTGAWTLLGRLGTQTVIPNSTGGVSGEDLHSQALLTAFLQSNQTVAAFQTLSDVTVKLPDLLKMIFDKKLYAFSTASSNRDNENFLERLVKHEAGVFDPATGTISIPADAMVTRFTTDLWQIAQDGGLTLNEAYLSRALTAFAMQKYYDETQASAGYNKTLFTGIIGGIQFDIKDVASTPTAAKGYADFRLFLEQYYTSVTTDITGATVVTLSPSKDQILAALSSLRDWYIQAGADALNATDTLNRNAFMFGDTGSDILTGGTGNDLLVGNAGADTLTGGAGDDWMIGGADNDILDGGAGYDTYILEGSDTIRDSDGNGILKDKTGNIVSGAIQKNADGSYTYLNDPSVNVTLDANLTLTLTLADGTVAALENFTSSNLGLQLSDAATQASTTTITGDILPDDTDPAKAGIQAVADANGNPIGQAGAYADILGGTAGNDHILSGELNDDVGGGAGDDRIEGGNGSDYLHGGIGNDIVEGGTGSDIVAGEDGNDRLYGNAQIDTAAAIANGSAATATGIKGDWLAGGSGDDTLVAGADNDVLSGGEGSDLIIAGAGDDHILGDADYVPQYIPEADPRYQIGSTNWYHSSAATFNWSVTPQPGGGALFHPVTEYAAGNSPAAGNDIIYAGDGADHVWAGSGGDVVYGEGGADQINGDAGNDILFGGAGDDTLVSGADNDVLSGGEGADILQGTDKSEHIYGLAGNDTLVGNAMNDSEWRVAA